MKLALLISIVFNILFYMDRTNQPVHTDCEKIRSENNHLINQLQIANDQVITANNNYLYWRELKEHGQTLIKTDI